MLILGEKYNATWTGTPPHMSKEDFEIWKRVREGETSGAKAVYYDVGLSGQKVETETEGRIQDMWLRLTQKRIDVLVEFNNFWQIIEVRHNATADAVGRLLQYKDIWEREKPDERPYDLVLITNKEDSDLRSLTRALGIEYIVSPGA